MTIPRPLAVCGLAVPWIASVTVLGWLFFQRFPLKGEFAVTTAFDGTNAFIHQPLPAERFVHGAVVDDPVYINAQTPGIYGQVQVQLEFRPVDQSLLEFGLVRDAAGTQLDLQPLYSKQLEKKEWKRVDGGYVLNASSSAAFEDMPSDRLFRWKFQEEKFTHLRAGRFTAETNIERTKTGGVLTSYDRPRDLGDGWYEQILDFSFPSSRDQLRFIFSAPQITEHGGKVELRRLTLIYKRQPLSLRNFKDTVVQELKNAYRRLRPLVWR